MSDRNNPGGKGVSRNAEAAVLPKEVNRARLEFLVDGVFAPNEAAWPAG